MSQIELTKDGLSKIISIQGVEPHIDGRLSGLYKPTANDITIADSVDIGLPPTDAHKERIGSFEYHVCRGCQAAPRKEDGTLAPKQAAVLVDGTATTVCVRPAQKGRNCASQASFWREFGAVAEKPKAR